MKWMKVYEKAHLDDDQTKQNKIALEELPW